MKVLIAGEGSTEIGGWFDDPAYRSDPPKAGVIEALLRKLRPDGWQIVDGIIWKKIVKYRAGDHRQHETRNVRGLLLRTAESGCDVVAFIRDRDRDKGRQADFEAGLEQGTAEYPRMQVAGGMAVEMTEAWILALHGQRGSERHADPKEVLRGRHSIGGLSAKVQVVEDAAFDAIPSDATSLLLWLDRARGALGIKHG